MKMSVEEWRRLWRDAMARQAAKAGTGARDKRIQRDQDNVKMHFKACLAEYAVHKLGYGTYVNHVGPTGRRDKSMDLADGRSAHVQWRQKWMLFNSPAEFKADVAILVNPIRSAKRSITVVGWIDRAGFDRRHFTTDLGYGERYCVRRRHLYDMSELKLDIATVHERHGIGIERVPAAEQLDLWH